MSDRVALIIANSEFEDSRLTCLTTPSHDADELGDVLGDPEIGGFEVIKLPNRRLLGVRREIARFYTRRKRDDLLLLYYSGHGFKDDYGDLYLAVKDTDKDTFGATAIDAAFVRDQVDKSTSRRKVIVLDCCHSGAFTHGVKAVLGSTVNPQEVFGGSGYGRVILTASNAVEYAWEGDELLGEAETSVFTRFLVQGLRTGAADLNGNGQISLDELYDYVYEQVVTSGHSAQTPQKWAQKVEGRIIIARNPHAVTKPAELPFALQQAIGSPFAGTREGAVLDLDHLLRGSDKGLAVAAREALELLVDDDSRRVSDAAEQSLRVFLKPKPEDLSPAPPTPSIAEQTESQVERGPRWRSVVPRGRPMPWIWLAGAGLSVLALIAVVLFLARGSDDDAKPAPLPTYTPRTAVATFPALVETPRTATAPEPTATRTRAITMTRERDGAVMVFVEGGTFLMGSTEGDRYEQPVHSVTMDSFWIDKHEVTNANYRLCVEAGDCDEPERWDDSDLNGPDQPVVWVTWNDANAYCQWAAAGLPTEAQWEYAARGPNGNTYPWGNYFDGERLNFCDTNCEFDWKDTHWDDGHAYTAPVGSYPTGSSWCDALDMAGNVREWVADWYGDYLDSPQTNPSGPETGGYKKVVRGGGWNIGPKLMRSAYRTSHFHEHGYFNLGFRCAGASTASP